MKRRKGLKIRPVVKNIICLFILAGAAICYAGCITVVEKGGVFWGGSAFAEKTLARYRSGKNPEVTVKEIALRNGKTCITITTDSMPNIQFYGSPPNQAGIFYLQSLCFWDSHLYGWNEFTLDIMGRGVLNVWENYAKLQIDPVIEILNISEGKIRYTHSYLFGSQALAIMENRRERIAALTQWMLSRSQDPGFKDQKAFEHYWFPILFPELVSPKARPPLWKTETAVWNQAGDIRWNETYTKALLPPELEPLRNSGTLFHDWEEAVGWIYLFYHWDRIVESLEEVYLTKKIFK
jgi:hypothetical protein